jgi:hypothetical protein
MIIVPFKAEHLHTLNLQSAQALFGPLLTDAEYGKSLEEAGNAFTGIVDGQTIICSGVVEQWQNRAVAWALISENSGKHFVKIHKAVSRFLKVCDYKRVEAYVDDRFEQGYRWMDMLGFKHEGFMEAFSPNGSSMHLYAKVKHG